MRGVVEGVLWITIMAAVITAATAWATAELAVPLAKSVRMVPLAKSVRTVPLAKSVRMGPLGGGYQPIIAKRSLSDEDVTRAVRLARSQSVASVEQRALEIEAGLIHETPAMVESRVKYGN